MPHDQRGDRMEERYGSPSRWRTLAVGLPLALFLLVLGGAWTLESWGVWGDGDVSGTAEVLGPILAGFGVALAWVCLRPRR